MQTLEITLAPVDTSAQTKLGSVEPKNDGKFEDRLRDATQAHEPRSEPPPDPPGAPSSAPPNSNAKPTTGEVDPQEPNAQENELDSKSKGKEAALALVALAAPASPSIANAIATPNATTDIRSVGPVVAPSPTPVNPANATLEVASSTVASNEAGGSQVGLPVDPSVPMRVRALQPDEIPSKPAAKPDAGEATTEIAPVQVDSIGLDFATNADGDGDPNPGDKAPSHGEPAAKLIAEPQATTSAHRADRTEATPKLDDPKPIDRAFLARQLADRIELMAAARPKQGVVVMLEPADLGAVTLVLSGDRSDLQAHLYSDNDRVREAIRQAHPDLVHALGSRGVNLTHLAVSTENRTSASLTNSESWKNSNRQSGQGDASSSSSSNGSALPSRALAAAANAQRPTSDVGVDLLT